MKHYYEATYILNIEGKEEGIDTMADVLKKTIESLEGKVVSTRKMDQRRFERVAGKLSAGYYLCLGFELDSQKLSSLEEKFIHDDRVYRQFYLKAERKTPVVA
ncbi:MAG: 30S ribosomal protein S6 [Candidatus Methylacidiphilales bacterium]